MYVHVYVCAERDVVLTRQPLTARQSGKPIDVTNDNPNDEDVNKKKPVIEILTKVSASRKHRRNRRRGYDSSSESESDDDEMDVSKTESTEMVIHSKHLKSALSAVVGYYPGSGFLGDRVTVEPHYQVLIQHREALAHHKFNQPACHDAEYRETTAKHIDTLLGFLDQKYGEKIREAEKRFQSSPPTTTFEDFWLLLKPGEVIYEKDSNGEWTPYVISYVETTTARNNKALSYIIECWHIVYENGKLRRQMRSVSMRTFPGEEAICNIPVIPAKYFPEDLEKQGGMKMAERQVQLGKLYWELVKRPVYKEYDGPVTQGPNLIGSAPGAYSGKLIVDAQGFERHSMVPTHNRMPPPPRPGMRGPPLPHVRPVPSKDQLPQFSPRCSCKACSAQAREENGPWANFEDQDPSKDDSPTNDMYYLVCTTEVPAFLLSERRWGHVSLDLLREVKADREAFKHLVLDDEIKLTVKALIGKFASTDGKVAPWPRDLVKNKGEGRIFLLHGSPGVGKTCTAECVAELTHRPLLSLTSGDISTDMEASSVERNLNYFLTLGERYGALVLLDEADVYLEERRTKDLQRNGLVSIFLRALEYYRGVLFLTTNRVEAFDTAFTSRIHVALHYRRLADEDRARIWANNFERLERDSEGKMYISRAARQFVEESDDVRALRWNGREIRNALQTAVALAETEALEDGCESRVTVGDKHLRAVVKMSKGFKDFLRRRRGWAEEDDDSEDESEDDEGELSSMGDD